MTTSITIYIIGAILNAVLFIANEIKKHKSISNAAIDIVLSPINALFFIFLVQGSWLATCVVAIYLWGEKNKKW